MRTTQRLAQRGFTLIELLVAVIAGMFVIVTAFLMAKGATRLFASESRMATAQLNVRNAMDRIRADLQRAAFQNSANGMADPMVCPKPPTTWNVQGLRLVDQGSIALNSGAPKITAMWTAAGLTPDVIEIQGNFATTDVYPVAAVDGTLGTTGTITLGANDPAVQRLLQSLGSGVGSPALAARTAFGTASSDSGGTSTNRMLRYTNEFGKSQYLYVSGDLTVTTTSISIPVTGAPTLATSGTANDPQCGIIGVGSRGTVNPVQTYRYWIGTMAGTAGGAYDWAYPQQGPGDDTKSDLLRQEIVYTSGAAVATGAVEIVAENIVDLDFAFNVDTTASPVVGGPAYAGPTCTSPGVGCTWQTYDFADNVTGSATAYADLVVAPGTPKGPHRIRSVRARVTGRNRELDRQAAIDVGGPNLLRIGIVVGGTTLYARTRTLQEEVLLVNQWGLTW